MKKVTRRVPAFECTIVTALNHALRNLVKLEIVSPEGWTISLMKDDWGSPHEANPPHTIESMVVGSLHAVLPQGKRIYPWTKVNMLARYTWRYIDWCSGNPEVDVDHEFTLWLALPDSTLRFDFSYNIFTGEVKELAQPDSVLPPWASTWVAQQEKKRLPED